MMLELGAGVDVGAVLEAFWRGSLGTSSAFLSGTLVRAIPLAILGVALSLAFRAGVFNIGGEGQFALGAVAATVVALQTSMPGPGSLVLALMAAVVAGGVWASIAALLRARFDVLEVISTIMLNFVALNLVSYLVRGPMQEPTGVYPQTESLTGAAVLPRLWPQTRLHAGLLISIAVSLAAGWFVARTAAGFRLRTVGASPTAALMAGRVSVTRVRFTALVASGALAGLAGGIEVTGVSFALYENLSPGYGFSAIAVALLARLHPIGVLPSALLVATLETGALGMQRDAGVPSVVALAIEALVVLAVIAVSGMTLRTARWGRVIPARAT